MNAQLDIPGLLSALMERAPAGFAIGLHIGYQGPTYLFQTYPVEWLEEYSRDGLVMKDPTVLWGMANRGLVPWDALREQDPAGIFDRARAHGLVHGFVISLERGGSLSVGSLARKDRPFAPEEMEEIRETVTQLHDSTAAAMVLSPETREALRHLSVAFTQP